MPSILVAAGCCITRLVTDIPQSPPPWRSSPQPPPASERCWTQPGAAGATSCSPPDPSILQHQALWVLTLDVEPAAIPSGHDGDDGDGDDDDDDQAQLSGTRAAELRGIVEGLSREETALRSTHSDDATR